MGGRAAVLPAVVACLLAAEADLGAGEGLLAGTSPAEVEKALEAVGAVLKVRTRPAWPRPKAMSVAVTLSPQTDAGGRQVVSFGVPFPPGALDDDKRIRVLDGSGAEVPCWTRPLVHSWIDRKKGAIRSALVQFEMDFAGRAAKNVTVAWDAPRARSREKETPVPDTQEKVDGAGYTFYRPKVLATLPPEWLCDSLVVWQQVPAKANRSAPWFDEHLVEKFDASTRNIATRSYEAHLFDRPATYAKIYARHGDEKYLLAAMKACDFYIQNISREGYFRLKKGDHKYVYTEGSAVLYMLTGDPRYPEVIERMMKWWERHRGIVYRGRGFWTERHHGFGMAANVHAYEVFGDGKYLDKARLFFDAALSLQTKPLDGKAPDGAWLHTSSSHGDGNGWTTSPWMSCFLTDAIWKYWMLSGDGRAAASLAMYARFTEKHSVRPDGRSVYYMANSPGRGRSVGGGGPEHNFEGCYLLAMGYWLSGGSDAAFTRKIATLWPPTMKDGANRPGRKFNWRFRETSMLIWFLGTAGRVETAAAPVAPAGPAPAQPTAGRAPASARPHAREPRAADPAPDSAPDAEPRLKKAIIDGVAAGKRPTVYVDVLDLPARGTILSADEKAIVVRAWGMETRLEWSKLTPRRFHGIARKYSDDAAALAAYRKAKGLRE